MCGRFAQSQTREDYLALLAEDIERDIPYDPEPIGRYNVAPGTKVLLLSERDEHLHLDPVFWGYAPGWWDKPPLRPPVVCLNRSGNMVGQSVLPMAGLSGKKKATKNSLILSIALMDNLFLWPR